MNEKKLISWVGGVAVRRFRSAIRKRTCWYVAGALVGVAGVHAAGELPPIEEVEAVSFPSSVLLQAIHQEAQASGWHRQVPRLQAAARQALAKEKISAAAAWFGIYRWSALWSRSETEFIPAWIDAVNRAAVGHDGMAAQYRAQPVTLGASMTPECQAWMIRHSAFTAEFFSVLQPVDYVPEVLKILSDLHHHDPQGFEKYAHLALAIAVVYDVSPPSDWPHAQVSTKLLPRKWAEPIMVFDWIRSRVGSGVMSRKLLEYRADELKHLVDIAAPLAELEWSARSVNLPGDRLEEAYDRVRYREDRSSKKQAIWSESDYALPTILTTGGICVDQAYFATQVGKGRGVPTLYFRGAGNEGRHAWFGFLDPQRGWQLNAGRYAEQRFVTGLARDPQTWGELSDHELNFLVERFRSSPAFQESRVLVELAADFLATGEPGSAQILARRAVNRERRNAAGWETLLAAEVALKKGAKAVEATLREAMLAFGRYPDLEVHYSRRFSQSLRDRGETSAADFEQRRIVRKYELDRSDLSLRQAREVIWSKQDESDLHRFIETFNRTVDRMGTGAGIAFFDEIVEPVVEHLLQRNHVAEARKALERAGRVLRVEPGSQLALEFDGLAEEISAQR